MTYLRHVGVALFAILSLISRASAADAGLELQHADAEAAQIVKEAKGRLTTVALTSKNEKAVSRISNEDEVRAMLSSCSDRARHSFLESLVLVDGKFAGAHVRMVRECLGEKGYQKFRDLFGSQTPRTMDHPDHWCSSRATCSGSNDICTSNCNNDGFTAKGKEDTGYVSFRELLGGCSEAERNRFIDSVSWEGGRIHAAEMSYITRCGSKTYRLLTAME